MNVLQRAGASVKAFQMRFGRSTYQGWQWGRSYTQRTREMRVGQGLESSVVVAPLQWMTRNFPDAPLRIRVKKGKDYTEIEPGDAGPGALLTVWANPNEYYDGRTLMKALLADYKTTGEAFVLKIRAGGSKRWVSSWWAPSWSMTARWPEDGTEFISHWEYNIDGVPQRVETEDVIHFRDGIDPINSRRGFCAFKSLVREVFTDEEASTFTAALLSNLGVPGVVISPAAATMGQGGRGVILDGDKVKQAYRQSFGGENRGEAMVLTAPTDIHVMSFNPQQLTLRDLRKLPEERVSGVFGIAAIVSSFGAGLDRSTFANFGEAREASYEEGLIPVQNDFASVLKQVGLTEFVSDTKTYIVDFDLSEVRVLQEDQAKLWERSLNALEKGGITRRRFKEIIGEEPDEKLDDVYYIPVSLVVTPEQEDQTVIDVQSTRTADVNAPGTVPGEVTPPPNPLTMPKMPKPPVAPPANGNGKGVPVAAGR